MLRGLPGIQVEGAQILELEADHDRGIRLDIPIGYEGFFIGDCQGEAVIGIFDAK